MADTPIVVTAGSVLASATALCATGVAGVTITAGQTLYKDSTAGNVLKLADANASAATAAVVGIALNGGSVGQPIKYVYEDTAGFTPGATLTVGVVYALSATPGGICTSSTNVAGDIPSVLFVAKSTTVAVMKIVSGGVAM